MQTFVRSTVVGSVARSADALRPLGFTTYEAKAYVALLSRGALNGYELAKASGVPRSMVYETLTKLLDKGAVSALAEDQGRYAAVPSEELLPRLRAQTETEYRHAEEALAALETPPTADLIHRLEGGARALAAAADMIDGARVSLKVSVWASDLETLTPALQRAHARGVNLVTVLFGSTLPDNIGRVYKHAGAESEYRIVAARLQAELLVIVADHREVLLASLSPGPGWAVRTRDRALVLVCEEYIGHDIVLSALTEHFGEEAVNRVWQENAELRRLVSGADKREQVQEAR